MTIRKQKKNEPRYIKKLRKLLSKDYSLNKCFAPINHAKYSITMENDYLSPNGYIIKKQHLEAVFSREFESAISSSAASFIYTWEDVAFAYQDKKTNQELMHWTFARGLQFSYYKTFFENCLSKKEVKASQHQNHQNHHNIGNWYDKLINVPAVNLLYMLTWDVIFFEEFNCTLIAENINKIGDIARVSAMSDSYVQLSFKGCNFEHSFFKNGEVYVTFIGVGLFNKTPCYIYEYRSAGRLNVERQKGDVKQEGESFFLGKVYLGLKNGDLIFGDLTELLTLSITNNQGKIVPLQKRRLVQLHHLDQNPKGSKSEREHPAVMHSAPGIPAVKKDGR